MNEEVIIENGDIPDEKKELRVKILNASVENEFLKSELALVKEEISKYPIIKEPLLVDVVEPGMYVEYDAGKWDRTVGIPSARFFLPWKKYGFSMFDKGKSKNNSVVDYHGNLSPSGWLVLGIIDGLVYLIHAGIACVYYPTDKVDAATEIANMRKFCAKEFADSPYAKEAVCATKQFFDLIESANDGLPEEVAFVGAPYWLATLTNYNTIAFFDKTKGGYRIKQLLGPEDIYGIRPVVILKENVRLKEGTGLKNDPLKLTF